MERRGPRLRIRAAPNADAQLFRAGFWHNLCRVDVKVAHTDTHEIAFRRSMRDLNGWQCVTQKELYKSEGISAVILSLCPNHNADLAQVLDTEP